MSIQHVASVKNIAMFGLDASKTAIFGFDIRISNMALSINLEYSSVLMVLVLFSSSIMCID